MPESTVAPPGKRIEMMHVIVVPPNKPKQTVVGQILICFEGHSWSQEGKVTFKSRRENRHLLSPLSRIPIGTSQMAHGRPLRASACRQQVVRANARCPLSLPSAFKSGEEGILAGRLMLDA